ncbi:hypothetical protein GCM10023224_05400 [Streptomonospora halophila]|uniref:Uncharacterized protein n=1 Tax=Streptomonospora halophila TaxID=427369 RepID=A0ABP9G591_9ACTN
MSTVAADLRNAAGLISIRTGSLGLATLTPVADGHRAGFGVAYPPGGDHQTHITHHGTPVAQAVGEDAADYLALWGPAVTHHLVDWLLYCADDAAAMDDPHDWGACEHPLEVQRAHGLASALLQTEHANA